MACVSFAFTALGGYVILWLIQSKTILYADRIEFKGVFSTKSFSHEDLRGWRVRPNLPPTLVLERKGGSSFKTSLVFRVDDEFSDWFESIPSLDNQETATSQASVHTEIESDARFGTTPLEKSDTLKNAKKTAKILSTVSTVVALLGIFYPHPYGALILVLALLPWIGIEIMRRSHGLFRADELKNDAHPSIAYALLFPGTVLALRAVLDYDVLQSAYAVALYVFVGVLLLAAILIFDLTQRSRIGTLLIFFLFGVAYGYGVIVEANALLDHSPGIPYSATVENKEIISGKNIEYRLDLSSWGPKADTNQLDVSNSTYKQIRIGQTVQIKLKTGALNVRWYYLNAW